MEKEELAEYVRDSYKHSLDIEKKSVEYGLSRGQQGSGNNDGRTIYVEMENGIYTIGRNSLDDILGNNLAKDIWDWINP